MARGKGRKTSAKSFGEFKSKSSTSGVNDSRNRLEKERKETREKYFPNREGVDPLRLDKRKVQADLVNQYKKDYLKPIEEVTQGPEGFGRYTRNLEANAPMSLEKFREQTVRQYGPTNREVMGDISSGLSSLLPKSFNPMAIIPGANMLMKAGEGIKGIYDYFTKPPVVTSGGSSEITVEDGILNNPLFSQRDYVPFQVSNMDPSTLTAEASGVEEILNKYNQLRNFGNQYGLDNIQIDPFNLNEGIGYQNQFMFNDTPVDYRLNATPSGNFGIGLGFNY